MSRTIYFNVTVAAADLRVPKLNVYQRNKYTPTSSTILLPKNEVYSNHLFTHFESILQNIFLSICFHFIFHFFQCNFHYISIYMYDASDMFIKPVGAHSKTDLLHKPLYDMCRFAHDEQFINNKLPKFSSKLLGIRVILMTTFSSDY